MRKWGKDVLRAVHVFFWEMIGEGSDVTLIGVLQKKGARHVRVTVIACKSQRAKVSWENQFMKHDKLTMNRCNIGWEGRAFVLMIYTSNENTTVTTMLVISYSQLESEAGVWMTHNEWFHLSVVMAHRRLWFHEKSPLHTDIYRDSFNIMIHYNSFPCP